MGVSYVVIFFLIISVLAVVGITSLCVAVYKNMYRRYLDSRVAEHSLGAVAKRQNTQSGAAYRRLGGLFVHLRVTELRRYLVMHPGVENTCAVDTQQHAQTRGGRRIIDVRKGVDA